MHLDRTIRPTVLWFEPRRQLGTLTSFISQLIGGEDPLKVQEVSAHLALWKLDQNSIHRIAIVHLRFISVCSFRLHYAPAHKISDTRSG